MQGVHQGQWDWLSALLRAAPHSTRFEAQRSQGTGREDDWERHTRGHIEAIHGREHMEGDT